MYALAAHSQLIQRGVCFAAVALQVRFQQTKISQLLSRRRSRTLKVSVACSVVCVCHAVEDVILPLRLSQFANHGALVTKKHGKQNASGRRDVVAAPNVSVGNYFCAI